MNSTLWVFDLDGVITDPKDKIITEPSLLDEITKLLKRGDIVAFNTGRAPQFMKERVFTPLRNHIGKAHTTYFDNMFAVGEKGGIWIEFKDGKEHDQTDPEITVPKELQEEVKKLIQERYSDCVFFDETKRTMISIEMHDGYPLDKFKVRQEHLNHDLLNILMDYDLNKTLKVDPSISATDIENTHVGKHLGAVRIKEWIQSKGLSAGKQDIKPYRIITFGDSLADEKMAHEFENYAPTTFVFVGEKTDEVTFKNLLIPQAKFTQGTLEYLKTT